MLIEIICVVNLILTLYALAILTDLKHKIK